MPTIVVLPGARYPCARRPNVLAWALPVRGEPCEQVDVSVGAERER